MGILYKTANKVLNNFGVRIERVKKNSRREIEKEQFHENSRSISKAHDRQTLEKVSYLKDKYSQPVFGKVYVWDLFRDLGRCIDPTDPALYCVSQLVHTLQVVEAMEKDGIDDEEMIIAGLIHDLGKLLLLTDEDPENIVCMNTVVTNHEDGTGLDNCIFQWNHDELVYDRFKDHVQEKIAWIIRYHSIMIKPNINLMNEKDRFYTDKYLKNFRKYDMESKSIYKIPERKIEDYRDLIYQYFPDPILF